MSKRICIFGSSIAHGYNDSNGGGWCDRLKRELFKEGIWSVYNLGISGDTSENVLERFELECRARYPKIVLIAIGINDSTFDINIGKHRVFLCETKKNLEKLISISQKNDIDIGFIGLTLVINKLLSPVPWARNLSYSDKDVKLYDEVIKKVAKENNVPFCSMHDLLNDKDLDDGLHPNSQGHKKIFFRVKDFLKKEFNNFEQ